MCSLFAIERLRGELDGVYQAEGGRVLATLIRLLGDFDLAEDAMQAAFVVAAEQWPRDGVPANPSAWLISTGRFKAIDLVRRQAKVFASLRDLAERRTPETDPFPDFDESGIGDDRLRLIFTCCHPALPPEAQSALTLREVCGLTTEEIAKAFLVSPTTIGQRIVRAKAKIREERIPYEIPPRPELAERRQSVLQVTYLLFSEGYYASSGESLTRHLLSEEAIRLGRLLLELMPDPEVLGLLGLMLLNESRRAARSSETGEMILWADQDILLWDRSMIREALGFVSQALSTPPLGIYALQAGIAALHVDGALSSEPRWPEIVGLYDQMLDLTASPVVALNRATAVAHVEGEAAALAIVDALLPSLPGYGLAHSTRADLLRRLERYSEALEAYEQARAVTTQEAERRFLERRIGEMRESS